MSENADCIKVAVRCRPLRQFEIERGAVDNVFQASGNEAVLKDPNNESSTPKRFAFDFVYDGTSTQDQVYQDNVTPLLEKAFAGFNATVFAYGQTGAGKSWTMSGNAQHPGIIPRMSAELFQKIEKLREDYAAQGKERHFMVEASFFEIYNEQVFDLLVAKTKPGAKRKNLMLRETKARGVYVDGLNELVVKSESEIADIISQGNTNRSVGATSMNAESSRSHSIFTLKIHQREAVEAAGGKEIKIFSKINLVDLAGSERSSKTNATGARLKEGANINKSLTTLGTVINTLAKNAGAKKKDFVPYRNSKLTRVLQESLGGNSLTVMIAALSPASDNFAETLSTLKYADRAKAIKLSAKKNDNSEQVAKLLNQIEELKRQIADGGMDESKKREMEEKFAREKEEMARKAREAWEEKERQTQEFERRRQQLAEQAQQAEEAQKQQALAERKRRLKIVETKNDVSLTVEEMPAQCPNLSKAAADVEAAQKELRDQLLTLELYKANFAKDIKRWPTQNASPTILRLDRLKGTFAMLQNSVESVIKLQEKFAAAGTVFADLLSKSQKVLKDSTAAPIDIDEWLLQISKPIPIPTEEEMQALSLSEAEDVKRKHEVALEQHTAVIADATAVLALLQVQVDAKQSNVKSLFRSTEISSIADDAILRRLCDISTAESGGIDKLINEQKAHSDSLVEVVNSVEDQDAKVALQKKADAAAKDVRKHQLRADELKNDLSSQCDNYDAVISKGDHESAAQSVVSATHSLIQSIGQVIDWRLGVQEALAEQSQEQLLQSKENMISSLQKELSEANRLIQQLNTDVAQVNDTLHRRDAQITTLTAAQEESRELLAEAKREAQGAAAQRDATIDEYRERESELLEEKSRDAAKLVELKESLDNAEERDARQRTEITELRVAVENLRNDNFEARTKLDAAKKEKSDSSTTHKQKVNELKLQLKQQTDQVQLLKDEKEKQFAASEARIAALEAEKAEQLEAERAEKWKIKEAFDKYQLEAAQKGGDTSKLVEELQQRVAELEKEAENAVQKASSVQAEKTREIAALEEKIGAVELELKSEQESSKLQATKLKKMTSKAKKATKLYKDTQTKLAEVESAKRMLENANKDAAEQAQYLEAQASTAAQKAEEFDSERAGLLSQIHDARKELQTKKSEIELLQLEIENQKAAVEQKENEKKQAVEDLKRVELACDEKIQQIQNQMDDCKEAERKALESVARMEGEVKRAQVFNYKLQKAVEMSDKSQGGIGATEVMRLEDKASRLESQLERAEGDRARLQQLEEEFHEQKLELGAARIKARKLETQINDLEGQIYCLTEEKDEEAAKFRKEIELLQASSVKLKEEHEYELEQLQDDITELKDRLKDKSAQVDAALLELSNAARDPAPHAAGSALQAARMQSPGDSNAGNKSSTTDEIQGNSGQEDGQEDYGDDFD